jgi:zinc finger HIT domain-containing protein 1
VITSFIQLISEPSPQLQLQHSNMPHVEVLPNSAASVAPGWTYVVDTGYDPSKVAINPKNKKRAAAQVGGQRGENELSARQQTAIARRIAELERDNDPKQGITIPGKSCMYLRKKLRAKLTLSEAVPKTQNARRIIQYQRQIKHWLDDEEAQLAQQQQAPVPRGAATASRSNAQSLRRPSTLASVPPTPTEATPGPSIPPASSSMSVEFGNDDALLSIDRAMPPPLNPADLEALLAAPPLSYAASHAAPPPAGAPPQRQFCDNCGYWGTMKCRKCGARVCGLECKEAHEATRCLKWA